MLRKLFAVVLMSIAILSLSSCGGENGKPKLYVYNWTYYISKDVISDFEKKFNCEVVYDVYASNEEMFAKLQAGGGTGYDVVFPSGDFVSIMDHQDMLEKLDKSKIPNFKNIDPIILAKVNYDKNNAHSVPYMMAASGIAVNTKYVKDYPRNFHIFERTDLKNRMTMLDDMREVIGQALKTLGYSVNSVNPAELEKAKELVLKWKPNLVKFDSTSFAKGFAAGEFWVVQAYAENIFLEMDEDMKKNVDFFIPNIGGTAFIDNMVILKNSKNKELAYQFINFIHEPEEFAKITDFLMLPNINVPSRKFNKVKPNYTIDDIKNNELKNYLGKNIELWNKIWQEIRIQS